MEKRAVFVVDWDGTCVEEKWPGMGDWLPGAVDALRELSRMGKTVIYSLRCHLYEQDDATPRSLVDVTNEFQAIRTKLDEAGLTNVKVYPNGRGKPPGRYYIDDRAFRFQGDWPAIIANIKANERGEVRVRNEQTGGEKGRKPARFSLLPWDVLWEDAELYAAGAEKYEARNWENGYEWSLSYDAALRHIVAFWQQRESRDPEGGFHHLAAARFHLASLMRFEREFPELDDRP